MSPAKPAPPRSSQRNPTGKDEDFEDNAWFVGFAPYRNPEIVVAAFVEHGGHGGTAAAPDRARNFRHLLPQEDRPVRTSGKRSDRAGEALDYDSAPSKSEVSGKTSIGLCSAPRCSSRSIGLTEIYSATMNIPGDVSFVKQAIFVCAGIALMFVISSVDYHTISEHIPWFYLGSLAVLIYTPLAARRIAGAKSWIDLGPVSIQPSEIIKMVVIVAMARYLADLHVKGYLTLNQIIKAGVHLRHSRRTDPSPARHGHRADLHADPGSRVTAAGHEARVLIVAVILIVASGCSAVLASF